MISHTNSVILIIFLDICLHVTASIFYSLALVVLLECCVVTYFNVPLLYPPPQSPSASSGLPSTNLRSLRRVSQFSSPVCFENGNQRDRTINSKNNKQLSRGVEEWGFPVFLSYSTYHIRIFP